MKILASNQPQVTAPRLQMRLTPWQLKTLQFFLAIILIALTLAPIINIGLIISSVGANNISNDYWVYVSTIDSILSGTYQWQNFFQDTFLVGSHSMAIPALVRLGVVIFSNWNMYVELYVVLALSLVKLFLLYKAFTYSTKNATRWVLWPVLAALIFSVSQINAFTFGDAGLQVALNQLGLTLGIWGLVRFAGRWPGIIIMALGGIMASFSGAAGLICWPVFLIGLVLLGYRKIWYYPVWLGAVLVAGSPYFYYIVIQPIMPYKSQISGLFNHQYIINALGWPFANDILSNTTYLSAAWLAGWLGIAFCSSGLVLLAAKWNSAALAQAAPALMLMTFGLLTIWQTSLFRKELAPWYNTAFMTFWLGLVGLAYVLWVNRQSDFAFGFLRRVLFQRYLLWLVPVWSIAFLAILSYLYLSSNITYADKAYYLNSRNPTSEACLRNYRTAPTYCEQQVFQWPGGNYYILPLTGSLLERRQLSAFAPHQQWSLQGDYILNSVQTQENRGSGEVYWSKDLTNTRLPWSDYNHLNLFLPTPNAVLWTISLPADLKQAEFHSAVAISKAAPLDQQADGVRFEVYLERKDKASELVFNRPVAANQHDWQPFSIPLNAYAGQTITLRLTSSSGSNLVGDWPMYRYPYIDVDLPSRPVPAQFTPVTITRPTIPALTAADYRFENPNDSTQWKKSNMESIISRPNAWTVGDDPQIRSRLPLNLCLSDYSHIYIRFGASAGIVPRIMEIYYMLDDQKSFNSTQLIQIPLQADGEYHEYTFDLKLLELKSSQILTGLLVEPVYGAGPNGEDKISIADFRLIKASHPSLCNP